MAGNDQGEDKGCGGGKGKDPAVDFFSSLTLATGLNSSSNTAISNTGTQGSMAGLIFISTPSDRNPSSCRTICTVCKQEFGCTRMYISLYVVCPYCNGTFLATEKAAPPNIGSQQTRQFDSARTAREEADTTLRLGPPTTDPSTMKRKRSTDSMDGGHEDGAPSASNNTTIRKQQPSSERPNPYDTDPNSDTGLSWGSKRKRN